MAGHDRIDKTHRDLRELGSDERPAEHQQRDRFLSQAFNSSGIGKSWEHWDFQVWHRSPDPRQGIQRDNPCRAAKSENRPSQQTLPAAPRFAGRRAGSYVAGVGLRRQRQVPSAQYWVLRRSPVALQRNYRPQPKCVAAAVIALQSEKIGLAEKPDFRYSPEPVGKRLSENLERTVSPGGFGMLEFGMTNNTPARLSATPGTSVTPQRSVEFQLRRRFFRRFTLHCEAKCLQSLFPRIQPAAVAESYVRRKDFLTVAVGIIGTPRGNHKSVPFQKEADAHVRPVFA